MVVHNLYVVCIPGAPAKTDSPLLVDADAVLTLSIPLEFLQAIARRYPEVIEDRRCIKHSKLPEGGSLDCGTQFLDGLSPEEPFGVTVAEALDHGR